VVCFKWVILFLSFSANVASNSRIPDRLCSALILATVLTRLGLPHCPSSFVNFFGLRLMWWAERVGGQDPADPAGLWKLPNPFPNLSL
jgi:hypothetical protein